MAVRYLLGSRCRPLLFVTFLPSLSGFGFGMCKVFASAFVNPHLAESASFMVASLETDCGRLAPSPRSQMGLSTGALSRSPVGGSAADSAVVPLVAV